jgi:hypothetical protein
MGAEDFRVRAKSSFSRLNVDGILARLGFRVDTSHRAAENEEFWRHEGAEYIIECETAAGPSGASIALRFAICQGPTVDGIFSDLVLRVVSEVEGTVIIAEDIDPEDSLLGRAFGPPDWDGLAGAIQQCIVKKRLLWQADFGTSTARLSCREAIERFVIAKDADLGE